MVKFGFDTASRAAAAWCALVSLAIPATRSLAQCPLTPFCQDSDQSGATASGDGLFVVADNFTNDVNGTVTTVCWRGGYQSQKGDCSDIAVDEFTIVFYSDAGICEPEFPIGNFSAANGNLMNVTRTPTGVLIADQVEEFVYTAQLVDGVQLLAATCYWIEITNNTDAMTTGCRWFWSDSPEGDGARMVDGSPQIPANGYDASDLNFDSDQAFCLNLSFNTQQVCDCIPVINNETCVQAQPVGEGVFPFSTIDATTDGPPLPIACNKGAGLGFGADVYFCYAPSCTGVATASFCNSGFDTRVAVYAGCGCPESSILSCNDDSCGLQSSLSWEVVAGQTYLIRVGGSGGVDGLGVMELTCQPVPTICLASPAQCNPRNPTGAALSGDGTQNVADDFRLAAGDMLTSICWWGTYLSDVGADCSSFPETFTIKIFDSGGPNGGPGALIASRTQGIDMMVQRAATGLLIAGFFPEFEYRGTLNPGIAVPGNQCLWIEITNELFTKFSGCSWLWELGTDNGVAALDGTPDGVYEDGAFNAGSDLAFCVTTVGNQSLADTSLCEPPGPPNDNCADAIPLSIGSTVSGNTVTAQKDGLTGSLCGTGVDGPGVWYSVIGNGTTLRATTCNAGTNFDTKLHVYCASCEVPTCVTGNNNDPQCIEPSRSTVTWCSQAGTQYLILVEGAIGATGSFQLAIISMGSCSDPVNCLFNPPSNDNCANAICINDGQTLFGDSSQATSDGGVSPLCPISGGEAQRDVWYSYTPALTGPVTINTCESSFDTVLAVFTSCGQQPGEEIACNDDSANLCPDSKSNSELTVNLSSGVKYLIRLAGYNNAGGPFQIQVSGGGGASCPKPTCAADIFPPPAGDGMVGAGDLGQLLASWGPCPGCAADMFPVQAGDNIVGAGDLGQLLANWGQCP
jgi:hypothetical protein